MKSFLLITRVGSEIRWKLETLGQPQLGLWQGQVDLNHQLVQLHAEINNLTYLEVLLGHIEILSFASLS